MPHYPLGKTSMWHLLRLDTEGFTRIASGKTWPFTSDALLTGFANPLASVPSIPAEDWSRGCQ